MVPVLRDAWSQITGDIVSQRATMEALMSVLPLAPGTVTEGVDIGGRPATWVRPAAERSDGAVIYFHGGAYRQGSPTGYRSFASQLAAATGAPYLLLEYRLAPEDPFPAAVDDAVATYRELLDHGVPANRLALAGDSAGGGLAVATLVAARDAGLPQPTGAALMSPWVDLTVTADSYVRCGPTDPVFGWERAQEAARDYLGTIDPHHPLASPLFADLSGIAPLLIHASDAEVLADDATALATRAEAAGVKVELTVAPDMTHVWHAMAPGVPEAREAVAAVAQFLQRAIG